MNEIEDLIEKYKYLSDAIREHTLINDETSVRRLDKELIDLSEEIFRFEPETDKEKELMFQFLMNIVAPQAKRSPATAAAINRLEYLFGFTVTK